MMVGLKVVAEGRDEWNKEVQDLGEFVGIKGDDSQVLGLCNQIGVVLFAYIGKIGDKVQG